MHKAFDIFKQKTEKELHYVEEYSKEVFERFKDHVETNRKAKLTTDANELDKLFNANIYLSQEAKSIG
jgi:ClpP class serine protease